MVDGSTVICVFLAWYSIGFYASHMIITKSSWLTWREHWILGGITALAGPINLIAYFTIIHGDDRW